MTKNILLVVVLLVVLVIVPIVSAGITVTPSSSTISTEWYKQSTFQLNIRNDNNFSIYSVEFSNTTFFTFPKNFNLTPNESRVVSYSVNTNELFSNRIFISTLSYFYVVPFTPAPKIVDVNVTESGFVPSSIVVRENDSVRWNNKLNSVVEIRDLGSGFGQVNLPALGSQTVNYPTIKSYSFYASPNGFSGGLNVVARENTTFEHSSTDDKNIQFTLSSVLPATTMQVSLLSGNITVQNGQVYPQALVEIRNLDPNLVITSVNVSGSRWIVNNSFSPNNFNLPANGIQLVLFDILPNVTRTNETNRTQNIVLNVTSANAGSTIKVIQIFVPYMNMDVVTINGTQYIIHMLSINETAEACKQHRVGLGVYDVGFESCAYLEVPVNTTIIKEVPMQYLFSEAEVKLIKESAFEVGNISQRQENLVNRYLDKQAMVEAKVENNTVAIENLSSYVNAREVERDREVTRQNIRFWVFFVSVFVVFLCVFVLWLADNVGYFNAMARAKQL